MAYLTESDVEEAALDYFGAEGATPLVLRQAELSTENSE